MESKYIIVARDTINPKNPAEINDKQVAIYGITNTCSLTELMEIYPQARQFLVLFITNYSIWNDLEDYSSSFRENQIARVNPIQLEKCRFLGYLCLDQHIMVTNGDGNLPITVSPDLEFYLLQEALAEKLSYHCRAPEEKFTKPATPTELQMLTNDQVLWLTQHYLKVCAGDRFFLDRHGDIELISSLDGTPAYFYPPYGDVEEVAEGRHRIDLILADMLHRLQKCEQIEKMPNELIINQIICLGTRRNTTDETGSHWVVRSVRLSGLNQTQLYARSIDGLYDYCTLSYLNSANMKTSLYFERCIKSTLRCAAKQVIAMDITVPNQFEIGAHLQKGIICGDLAAQNAVSFTIYGCVPSPKQYTTRHEHIGWFGQQREITRQQIRWSFDLAKTLVESFDVAQAINQLIVCDTVEEANQLINSVRNKVLAYIAKETMIFHQKNNTFLASLKFLTYQSRTDQLLSLAALQSLIPCNELEAISPLSLNEVESQMPKWNTAHYSERSKQLFDSVRFIEAIISRTIHRLTLTRNYSSNL